MESDTADDLADAVDRQQVDGMLGVERIHLYIDGSRQCTPLPPFDINIVADTKVSLQLNSVFCSVGPGDYMNYGHVSSRRCGRGRPPLLEAVCRNSGIARSGFHT